MLLSLPGGLRQLFSAIEASDAKGDNANKIILDWFENFWLEGKGKEQLRQEQKSNVGGEVCSFFKFYNFFGQDKVKRSNDLIDLMQKY